MKKRILFAILFLMFLSSGLFPQSGTADGAPPTLLVVNKGGDAVSFVDVDRMRVTGRVSVGTNPHEIALTPDRSTAVVTNYDHGKGSSLSLIDVDARKRTGTISLGNLTGPHGIVIPSGGTRAFVTCEGSQAVADVNLSGRDVTQTYDTEQRISHMLALHPDRRTIYTANIGSGSVSVIDLERETPVDVIKTGAGAEGIDLGSEGNVLWVTNREADTISVIDTENGRVVDTLQCSGFPIRVQTLPDRPIALVTCFKANELAIVDTEERRITGRMKVGKRPVSILGLPDGRAYIANTGSDSVMLIDVEREERLETVSVGDTPDGLAYIPER